MKEKDLSMFAAAPPGLEEVVSGELQEMEMKGVRVVRGGVDFQGSLSDLYRANLWLRTAARILVRLEGFYVVHLAKLHHKARKIPWENYLQRDASEIHVSATCHKSRIYHSKAAAERVAMGIAERLGLGELPDCCAEGPREAAQGAQAVAIRLDRDFCSLSLDSSGDHLHRRGYRIESLAAPVRENLAASLLRMCSWRGERAFADPMCGSGTIAIEAALMASHTAPGLTREFAFVAWPGFDATLWQNLREEASATIRPPEFPIFASDIDPRATEITTQNATRANVASWLEIEKRPLEGFCAPETRGLLLCNPPYGKRMGDGSISRVYRDFGQVVRRQKEGWSAALLTSQSKLVRATGLRVAEVSPPFPNGGTRVKLYRFSREG